MTARTLALLAPGQRAVVRGILAEEDFARRLMELGLTPGTEVALIRRAPGETADRVVAVVDATNLERQLYLRPPRRPARPPAGSGGAGPARAARPIGGRRSVPRRSRPGS